MTDLHYHKCPMCGTVWRHRCNPDANVAEIMEAHSCPGCGYHGLFDRKRSTYDIHTPTRAEINALMEEPCSPPSTGH